MTLGLACKFKINIEGNFKIVFKYFFKQDKTFESPLNSKFWIFDLVLRFKCHDSEDLLEFELVTSEEHT
jgi:hypothetical protein